MTTLEKAKEVIRENCWRGMYGIFNSHFNDDVFATLYKDDELEILLCENCEYFEVLGLSDEEFYELKEYFKNGCEEDEESAT